VSEIIDRINNHVQSGMRMIEIGAYLKAISNKKFILSDPLYTDLIANLFTSVQEFAVKENVQGNAQDYLLIINCF
jgi:hypothetical protein